MQTNEKYINIAWKKKKKKKKLNFQKCPVMKMTHLHPKVYRQGCNHMRKETTEFIMQLYFF